MFIKPRSTTTCGNPHPDTWYSICFSLNANFVPRDPNAHGGQRNPLDLQVAHHAQHRAVLVPYKVLAPHLSGGEKRKPSTEKHAQAETKAHGRFAARKTLWRELCRDRCKVNGLMFQESTLGLAYIFQSHPPPIPTLQRTLPSTTTGRSLDGCVLLWETRRALTRLSSTLGMTEFNSSTCLDTVEH